MFKTLRLYRLQPEFFEATTPEALAEELSKVPYIACGPTQEKSCGWVAPRGIDHAPLVESLDGKHWLCKLQFQSKKIPASYIQEKVDELADEIERTTGRKPGKNARKDLAEQAKHEALPRAFPKTSAVRVWFAREARLLCIETGSSGVADEVVTALIAAAPALQVQSLQTAESPAACMAAWLMDSQAPANFSIDRDCELQGSDEQRAKVRYANHPLDIDEVRAHLTSGKMPTKLAMSWNERVSFELSPDLVLKKIRFLDLAFEGRPQVSGDEAFDADFALATGELVQLLPALIDGLGGASDLGGGNAAAEQAPVAEAEASGVPPSQETRVRDLAALGEPLPDGVDPLVERAWAAIRDLGRVSVSVMQAKLDVSADRAEAVLEALERDGRLSSPSPQGNRVLLTGILQVA
jgi:recombination associated protein RdgC